VAFSIYSSSNRLSSNSSMATLAPVKNKRQKPRLWKQAKRKSSVLRHT
jgi:hypothetical protein